MHDNIRLCVHNVRALPRRRTADSQARPGTTAAPPAASCTRTRTTAASPLPVRYTLLHIYGVHHMYDTHCIHMVYTKITHSLYDTHCIHMVRYLTVHAPPCTIHAVYIYMAYLTGRSVCVYLSYLQDNARYTYTYK